MCSQSSHAGAPSGVFRCSSPMEHGGVLHRCNRQTCGGCGRLYAAKVSVRFALALGNSADDRRLGAGTLTHRDGSSRGPARAYFVTSTYAPNAPLGTLPALPWSDVPVEYSSDWGPSVPLTSIPRRSVPYLDPEVASAREEFLRSLQEHSSVRRRALTHDAVWFGPSRVREVRSIRKDGRRARLIRDFGPWIEYGPDHRFRLPKARGSVRYVPQLSVWHVGAGGHLHDHSLVLLPHDVPVVAFFSRHPHGLVEVERVRTLDRAIRYIVGYMARSDDGVRLGRVRVSHGIPAFPGFGDRATPAPDIPGVGSTLAFASEMVAPMWGLPRDLLLPPPSATHAVKRDASGKISHDQRS